MKTAAGADGGTVELPDDLFGIEPNVAVMHQVVTAQLAAKRVGYAQHQDPCRGARRWREAVAPEGHRPRPPGLDPRAAVARRRRGARPEAPRLLAAHPQEDGAPRAALGALRPGRRSGRSSSSTTGAIDAPKTKDAVELLAALGLRTKGEREAPRVLVVLFRTDENACGSRCATSASACRSCCPKS